MAWGWIAMTDFADTPAIREDIVPSFAISLEEARRRITELQAFVKSQMVEGADYGTIPGTQKPTLLKPGAEKLAMMYGFSIDVGVTNRIEDWERGFFAYECTCRLVNKRTGVVEAAGVGSCNSKEARYRWRFAFENELPDGIDKTSLHKVTKKSKKNGRPYVQYRLENEDPYTLVNTLLKMAKKRAVVDAVLSATRSSGIFTQDIEDFPDSVEGEVVEPEPFERASSASGDFGSEDDSESTSSEKHPKTPPKPGVPQASEKSFKCLFVLATKEAGMTKADFQNWLANTFGVERGSELSQAQVSWAIDEIKGWIETAKSMGVAAGGTETPATEESAS